MNRKSCPSIGFRLSISICMQLLFIGQPIPVGADSEAWFFRSPAPINSALNGAGAPLLQPAAVGALGFTAISASWENHTCGLTLGGGVKCWGFNLYGQLGDGTTADRSTPVDVTGLPISVTTVTTGAGHTCALTIEGGVLCWGYNGHGQVGDGTTEDRLTPVDVVGLTSGVIAIAAGGYHTCALTSVGGVKCWGGNWGNQLGDGGIGNGRSTPRDVVGLTSGVTAISTGQMHSCALISGGGAKCWGTNGSGELGDSTTENRNTPVSVVGLASGVIAIAAGGMHTCALVTSGGAMCWGLNEFGELGDGTTMDSLIPVDVIGLSSGITAIDTGDFNTCALTTEGGVVCWGRNDRGQLGDGTSTDRSTPVNVTGLASGVSAIATGYYHTCALLTGGVAKCWGMNDRGQLGNGAITWRSVPTDVFGLDSSIAAIAAGEAHTCALTSDDGIKCWGLNQHGQLGDATWLQRSTPVDVTGMTSGVTAITTGGDHTCAITSGGGVKCWGWNNMGQLGDGTTTDRNKPVDVVGLTSGVTAITAGYDHTCALLTGGEVKCWGANYYGELGDGTTTERHSPVNVIGLDTVAITITAGGYHTCARMSGNRLMCWGSNEAGQLGDGTTNHSSTPVDVTGLPGGVTAVNAGWSHTCALLTGGGIQCWGDNWSGQLGDGTTENRSTAVDVVGLTSGMSAIEAGDGSTWALSSAGGAMCWGDNYYGSLGDGTTENRLTPVEVVGLASGVIALAAGSYHACALLDPGGMKCWGLDWSGQLGMGTVSQSLTPVEVHEFSNPSLWINHSTGQPGSFFTLTGWNFPVGAQAILTINNQVITSTLSVNPTGSFNFLLDASLAEAGGYGVTVSINPGGATADSLTTSASASFFLSGNAPLRPQEGGGLTFLVPADNALHHFMYWPLVTR